MARSNAQGNAQSNFARRGLSRLRRHCRRARGRWITAAAALGIGLCSIGSAQGASAQTETLVFIRHAEKPANGYGQLDCQGLNRAMALPAVIAAKFGKPDAIFAPNPSMQKKDKGVLYDYVRPLATIEPTAIQFALPVNTHYGYSEVDALERELVSPRRAGQLIVTAWEHREIEDLVRNIVDKYGAAPKNVPDWRSEDFDSIYVVKLQWDAQHAAPRATFAHDREGLDGRPNDCPCAQLSNAPDAPAAASQ
jgi:broad specificity phosphatase PhoE